MLGTVDLDLGPGILVVHDLIAHLDFDGIAVGAYGNHYAGLSLFLCGLRNDDPCSGLGFALFNLDENSVPQGFYGHRYLLLKMLDG